MGNKFAADQIFSKATRQPVHVMGSRFNCGPWSSWRFFFERNEEFWFAFHNYNMPIIISMFLFGMELMILISILLLTAVDDENSASI